MWTFRDSFYSRTTNLFRECINISKSFDYKESDSSPNEGLFTEVDEVLHSKILIAIKLFNLLIRLQGAAI